MSGKGKPAPGRRQRRLGQNFLADSNLLDLIVRESGAGAGDVVLEVGGGGGALTERLAPVVSHLHVIELDRRLAPELDRLAGRLGNVTVGIGDALKLDLRTLDPAPVRMVSNLPYSIAAPLLLRTIAELESVESWFLMVQAEVADRLVADPGTRQYGSPSAVARLTCEVELVRRVDPAVFVPRPRVGSALIAVRRTGPPPPASAIALIRAAFAHRRKSLPRSLELARAGSRDAAREGLERIGLSPRSRAEALSPQDFLRLDQQLRGGG